MTIAIMAFTIRPGDYQDIREELRKRVNLLEETMNSVQSEFAAKQERALAAHKQAVDGIREAIESYKRMLALEESFADSVLKSGVEVIGPQSPDRQHEVKVTIPATRPALADFFIGQLRELGPRTKEELRLAAMFAGYFTQGDSGGRATHATLSNINRSGRVGTTEGGKYFVVQAEEKSLL